MTNNLLSSNTVIHLGGANHICMTNLDTQCLGLGGVSVVETAYAVNERLMPVVETCGFLWGPSA
jgi:hypothetical protein